MILNQLNIQLSLLSFLLSLKFLYTEKKNQKKKKKINNVTF